MILIWYFLILQTRNFKKPQIYPNSNTSINKPDTTDLELDLTFTIETIIESIMINKSDDFLFSIVNCS